MLLLQLTTRAIYLPEYEVQKSFKPRNVCPSPPPVSTSALSPTTPTTAIIIIVKIKSSRFSLLANVNLILLITRCKKSAMTLMNNTRENQSDPKRCFVHLPEYEIQIYSTFCTHIGLHAQLCSAYPVSCCGDTPRNTSPQNVRCNSLA